MALLSKRCSIICCIDIILLRLTICQATLKLIVSETLTSKWFISLLLLVMHLCPAVHVQNSNCSDWWFVTFGHGLWQFIKIRSFKWKLHILIWWNQWLWLKNWQTECHYNNSFYTWWTPHSTKWLATNAAIVADCLQTVVTFSLMISS